MVHAVYVEGDVGPIQIALDSRECVRVNGSTPEGAAARTTSQLRESSAVHHGTFAQQASRTSALAWGRALRVRQRPATEEGAWAQMTTVCVDGLSPTTVTQVVVVVVVVVVGSSSR